MLCGKRVRHSLGCRTDFEEGERADRNFKRTHVNIENSNICRSFRYSILCHCEGHAKHILFSHLLMPLKDAITQVFDAIR